MEIGSLSQFLREIINAQIAKVDEQVDKLEDAKAKIEGMIAFLGVIRAELEKKKSEIDGIPAADHILFYSHLGEESVEVTHMFLSVSKKLPVSLSIKDKFGNAAQVDGAPSWSLSDPSLGALSVGADGMSAEFTPSGSVGSLKIQVKADADLGEGIKELLGELPIDLLSGEATAMDIKVGEPTDA